MGKLKLLFITSDQSEQMEKNSHYMAEELKKQCEAVIWTKGGHILEILGNLPDKPDYLLLNDGFGPKLCPPIHGLQETDIPKGIIFHDLSHPILQRKKYVVEHNIDHIFSHYRDPFKKWYPQLDKRMEWLPHHVNTEIFKDYQLEKKIDWLMMGAVSPKLYPLRTYMFRFMQDKSGFVYHPHPGHRHENNIQPGSLIGKDYAMEINRAKMFLTCDSVFRYPLMKYFEVLACHTLLLAPSSNELSDLGFIDGQTFIAVDRNTFYEAATYYLHHEKERMAIAEKGYRMVRERHSTKKRVSELIETIENKIKMNQK